MNISKQKISIALLALSLTAPLLVQAGSETTPPVQSFTTTSEADAQDSMGRMRVLLQNQTGPQTLAIRNQVGDGKGVNTIYFSGNPVAPAERPQVVATSAIEPAALAQLTDDLKIMAKVIRDAAADDDNAGQRAMGITLSMLPGHSSRPTYVEGYGAIFPVPVQFPLAPLAKSESKTPPPQTNSAWDNARNELTTSSASGNDYSPKDDYDAGRVDALKKSLLKALANANHIHQLNPNDRVTIVARNEGGVFQPHIRLAGIPSSASGGASASTQSGSGGTSAGTHEELRHIINRSSGDRPDKTLTISVKKSDADALAAGKITEDEFGKRATIAIY